MSKQRLCDICGNLAHDLKIKNLPIKKDAFIDLEFKTYRREVGERKYNKGGGDSDFVRFSIFGRGDEDEKEEQRLDICSKCFSGALRGILGVLQQQEAAQ